jgi:signal transduction histidine kinase
VVMERSPVALHVSRVHGTIRAPLTLAIGTFCLVFGALQVRRGLTRIDTLRSRLSGLHRGSDRRLDGDYPSEIQPLVNDLNALLDVRERAVERAVAKAGDLAHGLKTPLAILAMDADRAESAGHDELAASMRQQVTRMRRQIDYHLAQARAAASGNAPGTSSPVDESAEGLRRAMLRLYADRGVTIEISVPAGCSVRVQRQDFDEMLGNLIDNACKWARSRVTVGASAEGEMVVVTVDDDGAGIGPQLRELVLQRGVRADEAAPGSGLGLAIVRDLAEVYGGSIVLGESQLGGLRASLRLPA